MDEKLVKSVVEALDRNSEALERIATALETSEDENDPGTTADFLESIAASLRTGDGIDLADLLRKEKS